MTQPLPTSPSLRIGAAALVALLLFQLVWHAWLFPPESAHRFSVLFVALTPLIPGLWICGSDLRRGVLIGAIVSLFYFCHAVAELWSPSAPRYLAATEMVITLLLIGASGWNARDYKRPPKN